METGQTTDKHPPVQEQAAHWDKWNLDIDRSETEGDDAAYCRRIAQIVSECAAKNFKAGEGLAVEVGCGTGWLCETLARHFGSTIGYDLSPESIARAEARLPQATFVAADFQTMPILGHPRADLVVSCEAVAHVANQSEFFMRCRDINREGGRLLLFTQNPKVWPHSSWLEPKPEGRIRHWPSLEEVREHFEEAGYRMVSHQTIEPIGDRGPLRWRPLAQGALGKIVGRPRAKAAFERLGLGRTLAIEAVAF